MSKLLKLKDLVGDRFRINLSDKNRSSEYVFARAIYFRLASRYFGNTVSEVARSVNRHHATVIHSRENVEDYVLSIKRYKEVFLSLCEQIENEWGMLHEDERIVRDKLEPHEIEYRNLSPDNQQRYRDACASILIDLKE